MPLLTSRPTHPRVAREAVQLYGAVYATAEDVTVSDARATTTTPRGVIWLHGSGGTSLSWLNTHDRRLWLPFLELAGGRYRIVAPRAGDIATGQGSYGNSNAVTAIGQCVTWAQGAGLIASGKVALAGHSMGMVNGVNWAARNASSVAGQVYIDGGCYLSDWYDNGIPGYQTALEAQTELNGAYGGNWLADEANRCPKLLADSTAALRAIPLVHYLAGDGSAGDGLKVIPDDDAATFDTSYGANCTTTTPNAAADHDQVHDYIPPAEVLAFLDGLTWI